ncbi:MAG: pyruvate formate-lyase-activating protein [Syntrophomonadaceae bacterium]|nr:pyruvate formate-lyase-activating protein [Syntrophomonadaceae bacterium]
MNAPVGRIHSIDSFSALDGPGLRSVVFLQGCALRCQYCHNPDAWNPKAPTAGQYTVDALMAVLRRFIPYYRPSGGGVTFSGGDPLLQHQFLTAMLKACGQENIHTAIESALAVSENILRPLLPLTGLFIVDLKHIDNAKSRLITGSSNRHMLNNIRLISESAHPLWLRYVLVPGLTDDPADLRATGDFLAALPHVERIELLPFHQLGRHKWPLLGLDYQLEHTPAPTPEQIASAEELLGIGR